MASRLNGALFIRLTLDFPDHPKIVVLSDHAFRALVEMIAWSRRQLTDGFIPGAYAERQWGSDLVSESLDSSLPGSSRGRQRAGSDALDELLNNDPQRPSLVRVDGGYLIRDFADYQETKTEVDQRRHTNRENGRRGGQAKARRHARRSASESPSERPGENVAETETETEVLTTDVVSRSEVADAPVRPDMEFILDHLDAALLANGVKKPSRTRKNLDAARLLLDRDGHTTQEVCRAIDFATNDEFWRSNILSMSKLREKYEQLRLAARRPQSAPSGLDRQGEILARERARAQQYDAQMAQGPAGRGLSVVEGKLA